MWNIINIMKWSNNDNINSNEILILLMCSIIIINV